MLGRLALHTWTVDTTPLATALDAARRGGFDAVELRRIDFVRLYEQGLSNDDVLDMVRCAQIPVCTLGCEYGWLFATGEEGERLFQVLEETCRNAKALDCRQIMCAPGQNTGPLEAAVRNLQRGGEIVARHGLTLAIEFNSQHAVINSLEVLRELIRAAGHKSCGMLLDAYHLHRSGCTGRGFAGTRREEIFAFQYSDCAAVPVTGVKRPTDRLMPGEGVVQWREVLGLLAEIGWDGPLSFEAPNPAQWERSPYEVCRDAVARTRRLIRESERR
jgi:sugar phosphate isomerase/epimerase